MTVKFGTSGLRGPADAFTPELCAAYVEAFLALAGNGEGGRLVFVGADLRASSPRITAACLAAIAAAGREPVYGGNVPTPALAAYALERRSPAIMVTGSHIPESFNGIKLFRRDGELLKEDEESIRRRAEERPASRIGMADQSLPAPLAAVGEAYVARYRLAYPADSLKGLKVGIHLHSAVGRDLTVAILQALGAECHPFARSERFVAVDTEALDAEDLASARAEIGKLGLHAVVSTDGDGDRPLVIDETGDQISGDVLGALTASALGIEVVVTPLTSTSAIEQTGWFERVLRTRIGSPYVVAAMAAEGKERRVAGFEANGGFLLGCDVDAPAGRVSALPTRDALLPIICVLAEAKSRAMSLSQLAGTMPARIMKADRLKQIPPVAGQDFLDEVAASPLARENLDPRLAEPRSISTVDGVRLTCADGSIVHFRQSGNAPELRCYVETSDRRETDRLLDALMAALAARFRGQGASHP